MRINVGSENQVKIAGVRDAIKLYPELFPDPEIRGVAINIETFGHPKDVGETMEGAIERAKSSFADCDYSFGLESGLIVVPHSRTGYMEVSACAIYDGKSLYMGLSPAFEWPKEVTKLVLSGQVDGSQAFKQLGLTQHDKMGAVAGGIVGFLTERKVTREDLTRLSIIMALIELEHPELY